MKNFNNQGIIDNQKIIDMGAYFYDSGAFTRADIKNWLIRLLESGRGEFDLERMFDIIIG